MVLKRQAERAETYEPGEHPVHVTKAELLTSARTGNVSVKLTAVHLEDRKAGRPHAADDQRRQREPGGGQPHRLSELARLRPGLRWTADEDANGDMSYDTDELIRAVTGAKVWVRLGARFDECARRCPSTRWTR